MGENRAAHLIVRGVSKRFGATTVLDRIDLTIRRGELVTLLGPSGCGKTTLLRAIAGLAQPDTGKVELAGRDVTHVPPHKRNVGVVFQSYALFPHLPVAGDIAFGLQVRGAAGAVSASRKPVRTQLRRALDTDCRHGAGGWQRPGGGRDQGRPLVGGRQLPGGFACHRRSAPRTASDRRARRSEYGRGPGPLR